MMTSWNELQKTEAYLMGSLSQEEALLFEAKVLTNPLLRIRVAIQKKIYMLIKLYGRKKLKSEMEGMHQKVFDHPDKADLRNSIYQLFNKNY